MWIKDLLTVCGTELKKTVSDTGVLVFFLVVPLLYPLLYAYLYSHEIVTEVPIVVVDECHSSMSREFLRKCNATPDINIVSYCADMEEARDIMHRHKAYGLIQIPSEFDKTLNDGHQATINLYCDMSGLLYYKALLSGCTMVSLDMNRDIQMHRLAGLTDRQLEVQTMPVENEYITMFNPVNGFQSFLIPAVLILLLQQTMLLGISMMAGTEFEKRHKGQLRLGQEYSNPIVVLGGKALSYLIIYAAISAYVLCIVPWMFHMPQVWHGITLLVFIVPFLLASVFFCISISFFVRDRESCFLLFVFVSVPLIFMSGISWPTSNMPGVWYWLSQIFPSTHAINGFCRINTAGAMIGDVLPEYTRLWIMSMVYFVLSVLIYIRYYRSDKTPEIIGRLRAERQKIRRKIQDRIIR